MWAVQHIDPLKSNFDGQNVLTTGAARGLGKEMAISYAKAGASGIALLDILDATPVESELFRCSEDGRPFRTEGPFRKG